MAGRSSPRWSAAEDAFLRTLPPESTIQPAYWRLLEGFTGRQAKYIRKRVINLQSPAVVARPQHIAGTSPNRLEQESIVVPTVSTAAQPLVAAALPSPSLAASVLQHSSVPMRPTPGTVWIGSPAEAIAMLRSEQFEQTPSVEAAVGDLWDIVGVNLRNQDRNGTWTVSVAEAPTESVGWSNTPLHKTTPPHIAFALAEVQRHGPHRGNGSVAEEERRDVLVSYISSGQKMAGAMKQKLEEAWAFLARYRKPPSRGTAHSAWSGDNRCAGRRANPEDGGFGAYAPADRSHLEDEGWLLRERASELAVQAWLELANAELMKICPRQAAIMNTPWHQTHNFNQASSGRAGVAFDAPQTTASVAMNCPAFGSHADLNCGILSPFCCLFPTHLRHTTACMQFLSALVYHEVHDGDMFWFNPDALHAFRPHVSLLTQKYSDYQLHGEREQRESWEVIRDAAREAAWIHVSGEAAGRGEVLVEGSNEAELRVQLAAGPWPAAGFVQEKVLNRMKTQSGDLSDVNRAAKRSHEVQTSTTVPPGMQPPMLCGRTRSSNQVDFPSSRTRSGKGHDEAP